MDTPQQRLRPGGTARPPEAYEARGGLSPRALCLSRGRSAADIPRGAIHMTARDTPAVPMEDVLKFIRVPVLIVRGDNIAVPDAVSDVSHVEV